MTRWRFVSRVDSWKSPRNRHLAGGNPPNDRVPRASTFPRPHVFEREVRDQVPGDVYEAQVALMEMSLDRDSILAGLREARRAATTT